MTTEAKGNDLPKLAAPARRGLAGAGLDSLAAVAKQREADVAELHGMGPNAMATLKAAMKVKGLGFRKGRGLAWNCAGRAQASRGLGAVQPSGVR